MAVAVRRSGAAHVLSTQLPGLVQMGFLFAGDRERASKLAGAALGRALARPLSARDPEGTEARALASLARRAPRRAQIQPTDDEPLWRAYLALGRRRRVALALSVARGMDARAISEVLGCSPSGAEALLAHARADLNPLLAGEPDAGLIEIFDAKLAQLTKVPLQPSVAPWKRRAAVAVAIAFAAGAGSVVVPRFFDGTKTAPIERSDFQTFDSLPIRRGLLPGGFDRTGPVISLAEGSVTGVAAYSLVAYQAEGDNVCFRLHVGQSYGDRHCISSSLKDAHAFASPDLTHGLTFIYGNVPADVAHIELVQEGASDRPFEVIRSPARLKTGPANLFVGFVSGYMLPMASKQEARDSNYELANMSLLGSTRAGAPMVSYELLLARPST